MTNIEKIGSIVRKFQEEADRLRAYYTERQKQYQDHPERFSPPALRADDDMSRYSPEVQQLLTTFDNLSD